MRQQPTAEQISVVVKTEEIIIQHHMLCMHSLEFGCAASLRLNSTRRPVFRQILLESKRMGVKTLNIKAEQEAS